MGRAGNKAVTIRAPSRVNRTRIEPKTYFANERTFIQWLSASLFLVTLAIALLEVGGSAMFMANVFFAVAVMFMGYSTGIYYWRLNKIRTAGSGRYDDPYGPAVLSLVLIIALTVSFSTTRSENTTSNPFAAQHVRACSSSELDTPTFAQFGSAYLARVDGTLLSASVSSILAAGLDTPVVKFASLLGIRGLTAGVVATAIPDLTLNSFASSTVTEICSLDDIFPAGNGERYSIHGLAAVPGTDSVRLVLQNTAEDAGVLVSLSVVGSSCSLLSALNLPTCSSYVDVTAPDATVSYVLCNDRMIIARSQTSEVLQYPLPATANPNISWSGLHADQAERVLLLDPSIRSVSEYELSWLNAGLFVNCA
jgi:uncharacterized membrane protein YidH (DUF202 family)